MGGAWQCGWSLGMRLCIYSPALLVAQASVERAAAAAAVAEGS